MRPLDPFEVPLSGNQLIEAAAGTGKTYTLASLFLRLVLAGRPVREILVVTFTEAATAELKDRLRGRLREAVDAFRSGDGGGDGFMTRMLRDVPPEEISGAMGLLQAALGDFDEAAIFTIHGFCLRALQENAFESGAFFDTALSADPGPVYMDIAADYWARNAYDLPAAWVRLLKEKKISVDSLARLLGLAAGHPDRQVLPGREDVSGDIERFQDLYRQGRCEWQEKREEIETLLATHKGVNRRSYNKKNLPRWLAAVDAYFRGDEPSVLPGDGDLGKFAQSRLSEMAAKVKGSPEPPMHSFFDLSDRLWGFGDDWAVQFQRRFVDYGLEQLVQRKTEGGFRFFDDLIQDLARGLGGPGGEALARRIRSRYPTALIDEFQDTDLTQYRIFSDIYQAGRLPLVMIGDPKQSIYAFRGADIFAYLQASRDAGDRTHTLGVNFRSDPSLIQAVNTLFDPHRAGLPFGIDDIQYQPVAPREAARDRFVLDGKDAPGFRFLYVRGGEDGAPLTKDWADRHLPGMVATDIVRLLSQGQMVAGEKPTPLAAGDIAVLVRTNRQGRLIQDALRGAGIPSVLTSQDSVFETFEAKEMWHVLNAVAAPSDTTLLFTALATDLLGVPGERIDALRAGDDNLDWWVAAFRKWHRTWQDTGFIQMMTGVFNETPPGGEDTFLIRLLSLTDGERRVTNFQHLAELLHGTALSGHLGPAGLLRWFERQRTGSGEASDAAQLRLESDGRAVRIVTIHKSKGLEYPVVYLPYLWDGALHGAGLAPAQCHLPEEEHRPVLDLGSGRLEHHLDLEFREQMAENLRLLYVALTRAKHACRVVWGRMRNIETSALGYLLHRPAEDAGGDFSGAAAHIKTIDDGDLLEDLGRLADHAGGSVEILDLGPASGEVYSPPMEAPPALSRRTFHRGLELQWRVESFSRLVAEGAHEATPDEEAGLDHDQRVSGDTDRIPDSGAEASGTIPLWEFSRGPDAGTFFHAIYEHLDFTDTDPETAGRVVSGQLSACGFDADRWTGTVSRAISGTLDCPLDPDIPGLTLRRVENARRLDELAFMFPASDSEGTARVTPERIGRIFESHAGPAVPRDYPGRVGGLRFPAIRGYLKGFIDLVFEFEGRWYLADYKSNHLGDTFSDYRPEVLAREMAHHHYFLQYHIYLAALHRYLAYRLPGYDYDRHFGGVYYFFIRGMSEETGSGFGVFRDRPGREMVEGLSGAF
jgi:exodeoxyribonuclease V beta subunit